LEGTEFTTESTENTERRTDLTAEHAETAEKEIEKPLIVSPSFSVLSVFSVVKSSLSAVSACLAVQSVPGRVETPARVRDNRALSCSEGTSRRNDEDD
jgi:hypothetical protein